MIARQTEPHAHRSVPARIALGSQADARGKLRVICVDDHELIAEGLGAIFDLDGRFHLIAALRSADGLVAEVLRLKPDVVIMDIELPGTDAFTAAERLHVAAPHVGIIFLTAHVKHGYIASAINCHADGYFSKADDFAQLMELIPVAARCKAHGFVVGEHVREHCAPEFLDSTLFSGPLGKICSTKLQVLTPREIEVLRLIGEGHRRTQIADMLACSVRTVDGHQDHIMRKLRLTTRENLIRLAIREGLAHV